MTTGAADGPADRGDSQKFSNSNTPSAGGGGRDPPFAGGS